MTASALATIYDLVDRLAEQALDDLADMSRAARARLRLPPVYLDANRLALLPPKFKCPECGGRLIVEVCEWSSKTGIVTPGGALILCKAEDEELIASIDDERDPEWEHRNWQSDWQPVVDTVTRFIARNVRVRV